jgi:hypothetical protein
MPQNSHHFSSVFIRGTQADLAAGVAYFAFVIDLKRDNNTHRRVVYLVPIRQEGASGLS